MTPETITEAARRLAPLADSGRKPTTGRTWFLVGAISLGVLIVFFIVAGSIIMNPSIRQAHNAETQFKQNARAAEARFTTTMAEFDAVQAGMSLPQVRTILHSTGTQEVHDDTAGITGDIYSWQNSDGSNMNVQFQNGLVIGKAQAGLQ